MQLIQKSLEASIEIELWDNCLELIHLLLKDPSKFLSHNFLVYLIKKLLVKRRIEDAEFILQKL